MLLEFLTASVKVMKANYMCLSDKALPRKSLEYFFWFFYNYPEKYKRSNLEWVD